jgi:hypothetical protein
MTRFTPEWVKQMVALAVTIPVLAFIAIYFLVAYLLPLPKSEPGEFDGSLTDPGPEYD